MRKGFINVYMVKIQVITDDYELESTKRKLCMDVPGEINMSNYVRIKTIIYGHNYHNEQFISEKTF